MTSLLYLLGFVLFIAAILISIGLHELGHLIPAKRFGGKVTQYFIGFGPTVWSTQRGETEVGIKAIPLGGYVKIVGMLPPGAAQLAERVEQDEDGNEVLTVRKSNTGMFTQLISDARAAEWEHVKPEDADRLFYKMAWWKKVVTMAGGPMVNIAIAFVLFQIVFATYGQRHPEPVAGQPVIDEVSACALPASDGARACTASDPVSPAAKAGLMTGDRITSFDGAPITSWQQLSSLIRANGSKQAELGYVRDGVSSTVAITTTVLLRPSVGADGRADPDPDAAPVSVGFLGVSPVARTVVERGGPLYTLDYMATATKDVVTALGSLPVKVYGVAEAIVGAKERDPNGPVSVVGGGRIAGEVASTDEFSIPEKLSLLLGAIAGFNLFIGLFNFVPLLPLDGGHIASALWEAVRRGIARLRRRPDPGFVDAAKLLPVAYVVASALLVMGVVLIVADIVVPVHLDS